jgi:hypothetical protein
VVELALIRFEQRLLGRSGEVHHQRTAALLHLRLERAALVLGGDERETHRAR